MPYTAETVLRTVAKRKRDLVLATADTTVSTTVLQATDLLQAFPSDNTKAYYMVYGSQTALPTGNRGDERRATAWNATTKQLTLARPGFDASPSGGIYEVHKRFSHEELLDAVNSAVRYLDCYWLRPVRDETITTVLQQWAYTLPAGTNWASVQKIHLQVSTDPLLVGYPYMDATPWSPRIDREVSTLGVETFTLRFGRQPPSGRKIRLLAEVGYEDIVTDADVLPLDGQWGAKAFEWLLLRASVQLDDWALDGQVSGDTQKYQAILSGRIQKMYHELMDTKQDPPNTRIGVPGVRDGMHPTLPYDMRWLAALHTPGP